jgi:hypothetical protein
LPSNSINNFNYLLITYVLSLKRKGAEEVPPEKEPKANFEGGFVNSGQLYVYIVQQKIAVISPAI